MNNKFTKFDIPKDLIEGKEENKIKILSKMNDEQLKVYIVKKVKIVPKVVKDTKINIMNNDIEKEKFKYVLGPNGVNGKQVLLRYKQFINRKEIINMINDFVGSDDKDDVKDMVEKIKKIIEYKFDDFV